MHQKVAQQWAMALRSGEYSQGKLFLECPDQKFCCLGVLCKLAQKEGIEVNVHPTAGALVGDSLGTQDKVREWAGMHSNHGVFGESCDLARMNDRGVTFKQIADVIDMIWGEL